MKNLITLGKIVRPHGVKGDLKVILSLEDLSFLNKTDTVYIQNTPYVIQNVKQVSDGIALKLEGINSMNDAENYRNKDVCVERKYLKELQQNEYYAEDLIGCTLYFEDNKEVGKIFDIQNYGATDILIIKDGTEEYMCPFLNNIIVSADLENKKVTINKKAFLEVVDYEDWYFNPFP